MAGGQPARADGADESAVAHQFGAGQDSAPLLADLVRRMPAAVLLLDRDWRFRYVNDEAERLMDRSRAELADRVLWDVYPGMIGTTFESMYRRAVATGEPETFEAAYPGPDDGWYEVRAWPGAEGLAICFLDVTGRRRSAEQARRAAAHSTLLARVAGELSGALDGESALGRLARLVVPTLTDGCIVTVVDRHGRARDVGSWHSDPARREVLERYTGVRLDWLPPTSPVALALERGTPVSVTTDAVLELMTPGPSADLLRALDATTAVVLPLPAEARTVGVLSLYLDAGRSMTEADLAIAREVAAQAGRAVERVHRASQQAQLAEALQRSLLSAPPELPGAGVAARYVPAAEAARVGGDWYDAFLLRDGAPAVVIGDVTGHDTEAAAAMGQLRGLLRGVAHAGDGGPAAILRAFDEAVVSMHPGTLATAALARIEQHPAGAATVRWASAGHPTPVVVERDGHVRLLGDPVGDLLLGVDPASTRREFTAALQPGDTLLLYTDGLVERPDATFDAGVERLVRALRELFLLPLDQMCDALLERMLPCTPHDDVALIAVRTLAAGTAAPR